MKLLCLILFCFVFTSAQWAENCDPDDCDIEDPCICSSQISPIKTEDTPQFVVLTIDDSVTELVYTTYYEPLFKERKNPDGNLIRGTFFVPHEYSDYTKVNDLYNSGHEIGVNSISKSPSDYWIGANKELLADEFAGQKEIISKFANIPTEDIKGARIPYLQFRGNEYFQILNENDFSYDNTWTSLSKNKFFPYTLDYRSTQDCLIGSCPDKVFAGFFVHPINNIQGNNSVECNVLSACFVTGSAKEIKDWLVGEFKKSYEGDRAPFILMVNQGWFAYVENSYEALGLFLDHLKDLNDVFIASHSDVQKWMRNPIPINEYKTDKLERNAKCSPKNCELDFGKEIRYMKQCVSCPNQFPWVGNPQGN